ncbi:hypothetical protein FPV67DRAFT_1436622 [Lyophyllum atratum]|nr:hypothetical protein FPV67DRAFT_1436622 [Lyophyllum atratum]
MGKEASGSPRPGPPEVNVDSTTADAGHSPVTQNHERDGSTALNAPPADTTLKNGSKIENTTSRASGSSKGHSTMAAGSPHKSSFMDKVKGEVKVISGKISHNDEKVEEGKRLLGKTV